MNSKEILNIVERYCRNIPQADAEIQITRIADHKTVLVEPTGDGGRTVLLNEYKIDGVTCWAGYSLRTQTVYISMTV